jgi:hypothetical protein
MNDENRPLKSFLLHGLIVFVAFAALGGAVVFWVV